MSDYKEQNTERMDAYWLGFEDGKRAADKEIAAKDAELARLRRQLKNLQEMYDRDVLEKMADEAGTDGYGRDV